MSTPTARDIFSDFERIDLFQILSPGGRISSAQTWNGQFYGQDMASDTITATPAATQANALLLSNPMNRVSTAASGSGVLLPPAIRGMETVICNDGANSIQVFASGADTINATAGSTGVSQNNGTQAVTIYYAFSNGLWRTK